jgi:hypothetical protein
MAMEERIFQEESMGEEKILEESQPIERDHNDRFNEFMFGARTREPLIHQEHQEGNINRSYIDYDQLMFHFDSLMESIQNLKPLIQKFKPFVQQIWKKK